MTNNSQQAQPQQQQSQPDVFDTLESPSAPAPQTSGQQAPQPSPAQGDVFDRITASTTSEPQTVSGTGDATPSSTPVPDALHIAPQDGVLLSLAKGTNAIGAGIGDGVLDTLNGAAGMLHLPHATLQERQKQLQQDNRENPWLNGTGKGTETLLELLSGDEALKGLSLSDRLMKSAKIAKLVEGSPALEKALHIGMAALRSGAVGGVQGTVKSGGDLATGAETGIGTAAFTGALEGVPIAVKAIKAALDPAGIQKPLQDGLRAVLSGVAEHHGLKAPSSASIRDFVQDVGEQLKARASDTYREMDRISGGQAQRFRDAAENVSKSIREIVGLDDEKEAALIAQQQHIEAGHKAMLDKLEAAGHPRDLLKRADGLWHKQAALSDLTTAIRQSVSGMRPELAGAQASAESVNPKTLFAKLNRLNDKGRLQAALGPGNAEAILQTVDSAYLRAKAIEKNRWWAGKVAKAAASAGLGGLGYEGVKLTHELLGK